MLNDYFTLFKCVIWKNILYVKKHILVDKHPSYQVTQQGKSMATKQNCSITEIQHHEAHFAAVLAENNLL